MSGPLLSSVDSDEFFLPHEYGFSFTLIVSTEGNSGAENLEGSGNLPVAKTDYSSDEVRDPSLFDFTHISVEHVVEGDNNSPGEVLGYENNGFTYLHFHNDEIVG